jgi:hypothetical protein
MINDIYILYHSFIIYIYIYTLYTKNIYIYKPCFCCFSSQTPSLVHMGSTMSQTVANSRRVVLVWGCTWQPRSLPLNIEVAIVAEPRFGSTWHLVEDTLWYFMLAIENMDSLLTLMYENYSA